MKICIVSEFYPYEDEALFTFVQQLAHSLSNIGCECSVIAPQSITKYLLGRVKKKPFHCVDKNPEGKIINIYRPKYITFSNTKNTFLKWISNKTFSHGFKKSLGAIGSVDVLYTYFWHVGLSVADTVGKQKTTPIIVQASECEISVDERYLDDDLINRVNGVVCASGKNKTESIEAGLLRNQPSVIAVNGYRKDQFYHYDKAKAREKMGIPQDRFIVAFVGGFIKRKGLPQLCEALDRFDDVFSIFIGKGEEPVTCKNVLFSSTVKHENIVDYLNCADIFVLPTEAEGCCNAIIEALACGLPVVSSNKNFNDEILDENCSIRINEHSSDEIYEAIKLLKENNALRHSMSVAALEKAKELTIENRAEKIMNFIKEILNNYAENKN